ncbi:hypothetical protein ES332_A05G325400v1 [Gossypium tomentosum]|uniref:Uncharacterized protein n=1 Tax=Gossypium tomentosum TaxID=34277 RepID=A0A5D2QMD6_GOSTO|nr:hypothetical protein ES332_A05G325400v1 [Gossypium tomentosum]
MEEKPRRHGHGQLREEEPPLPAITTAPVAGRRRRRRRSRWPENQKKLHFSPFCE